MRLKTLVSVVVFFSIGSIVRAQDVSLEDLHRFLTNESTISGIIEDPVKAIEFREMLKKYMGYDDEFNPIFNAINEQLRELDRQIEGFDNRVMRQNELTGEPIKVEGTKQKRSGIETDRAQAESVLENLRAEFHSAADVILAESTIQKRRAKLKELENDFLKEYAAFEKRFDPSIVNPSRSHLRRHSKDSSFIEERKRFASEKRTFLETHVAFRAVVGYLRYQISGQEMWLDVFRRPFAEDHIESLRDLSRLTGVDSGVSAIVAKERNGKKQSAVMLELAKSQDSFLKIAEEEFRASRDAQKQINSIATPREPQIFFQERTRLTARYPNSRIEDLWRYFTPAAKRAALEWQKQRNSTYDIKSDVLEEAHRDSRFRLPVAIDSKRNKRLQLHGQGAKDVLLKPMHRLLTMYTGYCNNECVGGGNINSLTARRFALSALQGVKSYAAEIDGRFNGILRKVPVQNQKTGDRYEIVDIMIRGIDGTQEITSNLTKQSTAYPIFDAIIDQLPLGKDSLGIMAGDGHSISQNTKLGDLYRYSPSFIESEKIQLKSDIAISDSEMERAVNRVFPETPMGYNPGGMIYEGMDGDGAFLYVLKPKYSRRKYTLGELENILKQSRVMGEDISKSHAWSLAVESDIKLNSLTYYKNLPLDNLETETILNSKLAQTAFSTSDIRNFSTALASHIAQNQGRVGILDISKLAAHVSAAFTQATLVAPGEIADGAADIRDALAIIDILNSSNADLSLVYNSDMINSLVNAFKFCPKYYGWTAIDIIIIASEGGKIRPDLVFGDSAIDLLAKSLIRDDALDSNEYLEPHDRLERFIEGNLNPDSPALPLAIRVVLKTLSSETEIFDYNLNTLLTLAKKLLHLAPQYPASQHSTILAEVTRLLEPNKEISNRGLRVGVALKLLLSTMKSPQFDSSLLNAALAKNVTFYLNYFFDEHELEMGDLQITPDNKADYSERLDAYNRTISEVTVRFLLPWPASEHQEVTDVVLKKISATLSLPNDQHTYNDLTVLNLVHALHKFFLEHPEKSAVITPEIIKKLHSISQWENDWRAPDNRAADAIKIIEDSLPTSHPAAKAKKNIINTPAPSNPAHVKQKKLEEWTKKIKASSSSDSVSLDRIQTSILLETLLTAEPGSVSQRPLLGAAADLLATTIQKNVFDIEVAMEDRMLKAVVEVRELSGVRGAWTVIIQKLTRYSTDESFNAETRKKFKKALKVVRESVSPGSSKAKRCSSLAKKITDKNQQ